MVDEVFGVITLAAFQKQMLASQRGMLVELLGLIKNGPLPFRDQMLRT